MFDLRITKCLYRISFLLNCSCGFSFCKKANCKLLSEILFQVRKTIQIGCIAMPYTVEVGCEINVSLHLHDYDNSCLVIKLLNFFNFQIVHVKNGNHHALFS